MSFVRNIPRVSIVVPSWFSKDQHGRYGQHETFRIASLCMKRMKETIDETVELIIVDNGSTLTDDDVKDDVSIPYRVSWYWAQADVVIKNPKNLGFAPSVNQGFALARGEYVIQSNNDIFVWDGWYESLIELLNNTELSPLPALTMPNLVKSQYQKDCLREDGGKLDTFKVMALKKEQLVLPHPDAVDKGAEFGSMYCAKRSFLEEFKMKHGHILNEAYLAGFKEDREFYRCIREMGFETYRSNKVRVNHVGNMTISKVPDKNKYVEANRKLFEERWGKEDTTKKFAIG